jgi:hypothetical protein
MSFLFSAGFVHGIRSQPSLLRVASTQPMMIVETLRQRRWMLLTLDTLVDFFAMNGDIFRCADANAHLVGLHANDGHGDIVADHKSLANPSCQYQHGTSLAIIGMPQGASRTITALTPRRRRPVDTKEVLVSRQRQS